jgi:hypothetical protein
MSLLQKPFQVSPMLSLALIVDCHFERSRKVNKTQLL